MDDFTKEISMILSVCDNPSVLEIMKIIKTAITIIKIVVPLILIISLMIGYTRAVANKDNDALAKANKNAVAKIIAAVLIFLIPTFVNIIVKISNGDDNYISCLKYANKEGIQSAYKKIATNYVNNVKNTLSSADYIKAVTYINNNIKNESEKNELLNILNEYKTYIDIKEEIGKLKTNYNENKYNEIQNKIKNIKESTVKSQL